MMPASLSVLKERPEPDPRRAGRVPRGRRAFGEHSPPEPVFHGQRDPGGSNRLHAEMQRGTAEGAERRCPRPRWIPGSNADPRRSRSSPRLLRPPFVSLRPPFVSLREPPNLPPRAAERPVRLPKWWTNKSGPRPARTWPDVPAWPDHRHRRTPALNARPGRNTARPRPTGAESPNSTPARPVRSSGSGVPRTHAVPENGDWLPAQRPWTSADNRWKRGALYVEDSGPMCWKSRVFRGNTLSTDPVFQHSRCPPPFSCPVVSAQPASTAVGPHTVPESKGSLRLLLRDHRQLVCSVSIPLACDPHLEEMALAALPSGHHTLGSVHSADGALYASTADPDPPRVPSRSTLIM
jgi:hypothetical protein